MNIDSANEIAKKHLEENPLDDSDFQWVLSIPKQIKNGWYYDYKYELIPGKEDPSEIGFSGAPGFLVSSDGKVQDLSWDQYQSLE